MALLNKTDAGLLWLCGLVAFAAILVIVLALCFTANNQSSGCKDEPACRNGDTSCCQPDQPPCTDTGSGQPGECGAGEEAPREAKFRHEIIVNPEDNPWLGQLIMKLPGLDLRDHVTESRLRAFIPGKLLCKDTQQFDMSGFIHFGWKKAGLNSEAIEKIRRFMDMPGRIEQLWIFSFTSPDGKEDHNDALAKERACVVQKELSKITNRDITTRLIVEDNPINGIANSRSVVIAACRVAPGEAETDGNPGMTTPSCSAPD